MIEASAHTHTRSGRAKAAISSDRCCIAAGKCSSMAQTANAYPDLTARYSEIEKKTNIGLSESLAT